MFAVGEFGAGGVVCGGNGGFRLCEMTTMSNTWLLGTLANGQDGEEILSQWVRRVKLLASSGGLLLLVLVSVCFLFRI